MSSSFGKYVMDFAIYFRWIVTLESLCYVMSERKLILKKTFLLSQMVTSWTYFFAFENQNQTILPSIGLDIMHLEWNSFILHVWIFASLAFALPCETKSWWYEGDLFVFYVSKPSWDLDVVSYSTEQ